MENRLYSVIKERMFEEFNASIQRHPVYAKDAKAYHRLNMAKERPQLGVVLMSTSANRMALSADDFMGTLRSHANLVKAGAAPGTSIEWVWEDSTAVTKYIVEDITASADLLTRRIVNTSHFPIASGDNNTNVATSFGQLDLRINGISVIASYMEGATGKIVLPTSVAPTDKVTVGYYYVNLDDPGFYFLEMLTENTFVITPMLSVFDEVVVKKTTGTEVTAQLINSPVLVDYILTMYTKVQYNSTVLELARGVDYDVQQDGTISFLKPLRRNTTLYATYRYQGTDRGPYTVTSEYMFNSNAIRGVTLAFGSRMSAGDKQVIVLTNTRETVASVYGGHYNMSLEWKVFSRDPETTAELTDHIISDIWGLRKEPLRFEGLTITSLEPSGESEESYDDSTQQMYFQSSITMEIMTEWKRFVPYVIKLNKFNFNVLRYSETGQVTLSGINSNAIIPVDLWVDPKPFTVTYPSQGYPVYF